MADGDLFDAVAPESGLDPRFVAVATDLSQAPATPWPIIWDCEGRGFGRIESPSEAVSAHTINAVLDRAREAIGLTTHVTAHVAKHSYCTNWIRDIGSNEYAMEKLSRQVGTSVSVLRSTYVHITLDASDWQHLKTLGA